MRMEIEKKVGGPRIRQQTLGPFHVADTVGLSMSMFAAYRLKQRNLRTGVSLEHLTSW